MGGTDAACALLVDEDFADGVMASVPAMLAYLTQQPQDGEPSHARRQAQREAAQEQSAGSRTGNVLPVYVLNHAFTSCSARATDHTPWLSVMYSLIGQSRPAQQAERAAKPPRRHPAATRAPKVGTSSKFRGVTRHSTTGRFEAHLWDSSSIRPKSVRRLPSLSVLAPDNDAPSTVASLLASAQTKCFVRLSPRSSKVGVHAVAKCTWEDTQQRYSQTCPAN